MLLLSLKYQKKTIFARLKLSIKHRLLTINTEHIDITVEY